MLILPFGAKKREIILVSDIKHDFTIMSIYKEFFVPEFLFLYNLNSN